MFVGEHQSDSSVQSFSARLSYEVCQASDDTRLAKALVGDASTGVLLLTLGSDGR